MILLKRLTGATLALNPDLMERVEANPDTVITMTDGKKLLVQETIDTIVETVLQYRAEILRRAYEEVPTMPRDASPALRLIVGPDESEDETGADHGVCHGADRSGEQ